MPHALQGLETREKAASSSSFRSERREPVRDVARVASGILRHVVVQGRYQPLLCGAKTREAVPSPTCSRAALESTACRRRSSPCSVALSIVILVRAGTEMPADGPPRFVRRSTNGMEGAPVQLVHA